MHAGLTEEAACCRGRQGGKCRASKTSNLHHLPTLKKPSGHNLSFYVKSSPATLAHEKKMVGELCPAN